MPHPLEQQIAGLRRKVRLLTWLHGLSWVAACTVAAVIGLALLDYLIHFHDRGIRVIASLAALTALVLATTHYLLRGALARFRDMDLALRVEKRFPQLQDRLASTLQFLREPEDDPHAGSAALRRAVIAQTTSELEGLTLGQVVNPRPALRAGLLAAAIAAIAGALIALDPGSSRIALARLANPFGEVAWPQRSHLAFREPVTRAALGSPLELSVVDANGARLPDEVTLHLRFQGGDEEKTEKMRFVDGAMIYRRESVNRPFSYRAEGGDDRSMPWIDLEVVEPPAVESLAATITPPEYTHWPVEKSQRHVRALKGSQVWFEGASTKPLKSAALCLETGEEIPAAVSEDGYSFATRAEGDKVFTVLASTAYFFKLVDREDFEGRGDRYEIRCETDLPPNVVIQHPNSDLFVTSIAEVPLQIQVDDDLAVRQVDLRYTRSDHSDQGDISQRLHPPASEDVPAKPEAQPKGLSAKGAAAPVSVEYVWRLEELKLPAGAQVTFHITASDYLPQEGRSVLRRLTIISADELYDRLAERQTSILGELARVLEIQRQSRTQLQNVQIQQQDVGALKKADLDRLQAAELTQRQVNRALTSDTEGVPALVNQLLTDLRNNKVDSPDIERRMMGLLLGLGHIEQEHIPPITTGLTSAIKTVQSDLNDNRQQHPASVGENLDLAAGHQDQAIAALEQMLGEMTQWDNYRRFFREITGLRREHEDISRQTAEMAAETLARDIKNLTPQQQADLKKIGRRQQELARRFDNVQQNMQQMAQQLGDQDPLAAGVLSDALHRARSQGISGKMRQAGQNTEQNQVGQAGQTQKQVNEDLREVLDILANRRESELSRLVEKLREAERELGDLRRREALLRSKIGEAEKNPDEKQRRRELERLRREQEQLQKEAERFARKLQRLQSQQAGQKVARAGQQMGQASKQAGDGQAGESGESAEQALADLEEAQQQLAQDRQKAETDLAVEQLAKIEDALQGLKGRQETVISETRRLAELRAANGNLTRGQRASLLDLARQESAIETETLELAKKLAAAEVFSLALRGGARDLKLAADLLARQETGQSAMTAEQNALRRFEQLLSTLASDQDKPGGKKKPGGQAGQGGGQQGQQDGIPEIAQLKMLKLMQEEINMRTSDLQERYGKQTELTDIQQREFDNVSQQQGELADLMFNLSKPTKAAPEDDPEKLPDFSLDGLESPDKDKQEAKPDDRP